MNSAKQLTILLGIATLIIACSSEQSEAPNEEKRLIGHPSSNFVYLEDQFSESFTHLEVDTLPEQAGRRELLYVPVYSDIYIREKNMRIPLITTMTIRNVSVDEPMFVSALDFFDSDGKPLYKYIKKPIKLAPLQSVWIVVNERDHGAGTGANFLVDWMGSSTCPDPVVEALMTGSSYQLGISFKSESVISKAWENGVELPVSRRSTSNSSIEVQDLH